MPRARRSGEAPGRSCARTSRCPASPDIACRSERVERRIPAHLEVAGLIRAVEAAGGFGTVIARGERDAGTLLVVCCESGANAAAFERMPQSDGTRAWTL